MGFLDDINVTQYELVAIRLTQDGADVVATFEFKLYSVSGIPITHKDVPIDLSAGEKSALVPFVVGKLADFEAMTGLSKFVMVEPEGENPMGS